MPARSLPLQRDLCTMKQNRTKEDKVKCQSLLIRVRYMNRLSGNTNWQEYKKSTYYSISRKITSFEYKRIDTLSFFSCAALGQWMCARSGWDDSALLALCGVRLACASGGGCYTCALLTSDKEIFQPTRVTEQRSLKHRSEGTRGLKQANTAAQTDVLIPTKHCQRQPPGWLVHALGQLVLEPLRKSSKCF